MSKGRILLYEHHVENKNNLLGELIPVLSEDHIVQRVGAFWCKQTDNKIPNDTIATISLGFGNGPGGLTGRGISAGVDYYIIDRAYFNTWGNQNEMAWCRFTKNKLIEYDTGVAPSDRYERYHAERHPVQPWRSNVHRASTILMLPPSYINKWFYNVWDWEEETYKILRNVLQPCDYERIVIRYRNVDNVRSRETGLRVKERKVNNEYTAEEDLQRAGIVIAYNTSMALDAVMMGIPVITSKFASAAPLSSSLGDLKNGGEFPYDIPEPAGRREHAWWLSYKQFNRWEFRDGTAWRAVR